ncbi:hypothetical protein QJS10_CPB20g00705 [Acorus calamus]|uniref:Uncharacterized protein n=1 Tax=Acorus calamus TaxID=4465 RepID=A0AAV9CA84_ACOCL|nr:hypothetical protein QJS10_CPB20g00705 [Acorus calamus]
MKPSVEDLSTNKGGKTVVAATTTKGKEKVTSQWVEVKKSNTNSQEKLLSDAMKTDPSPQQIRLSPPNKFSILQGISESGELTKEVSEHDQAPTDSLTDIINFSVEDPMNLPSPLAQHFGPDKANTVVSNPASQSTTLVGTPSTSATAMEISQRIHTMSHSSLAFSSQSQAVHASPFDPLTPSVLPSTKGTHHPMKPSSSEDEIFPPTYLFDSPRLASEVLHLLKIDIPLEIVLSSATPETITVSQVPRIKKGSGRNHKNKSKGGGSPQSAKKSKVVNKDVLPTKKSIKSYLV